MKIALRFALAGVCLLAPLAAFADPLPAQTGIYLQAEDLARGGAAYASSGTVTIYSGGGATESDSGQGTYHVTQTPIALGALSGAIASYNADGAVGNNNGTFNADASLATATVGGTVSGNTRGVTTALFSDILTFHVAAGGSAEVGVGTHLGGSIARDDGTDVVQFLLDMNLEGVDAELRTENDGTVDPGYVSTASAFTNTATRFTGNSGFDFTGDYAVTDGQVDRVQLSLSLDCSGDSFACSFANGGKLTFDLPDGVTVTSASGVFDTAGVGAVPEPANLALMLAGLVGIAGMAARRRKADARTPQALG